MTRARLVAVLVGVVLSFVVWPAAHAAPDADHPALPAPFSSWDVAIDHSGDPHVEWVDFDSPVLGRRVSMRVVIPDAYASSPAPLPVVYYLHGTIRIGTDPHIDALFDQLAGANVNVGYPFGPGNAHNEASYLAQDASRLQFLVVSPDAEQSDPWCEHCGWVDGLNGHGVAAETNLYNEVIPLTQALFRVRTDRAGRGIMGASMGGGGALIQATRHPDEFSVVAALSPPIDYLYDTPYADLLWFLYLREQGYPPPLAVPIAPRAINAADLLTNLKGEGIDTVITVGDGCVLTAGQGECAKASALDQPIDAFQEIFIRHNLDRVVPPAIAQGVPLSYITYDGVHFVVNGDVFAQHLLDRMNADFAAPAPVPGRVGYRSADPTFSIWGWDLAMRRPNQELVSLDLSTAGDDIGIQGSGVADVTTPARFAPGSPHTVTVSATWAGTALDRYTAIADAAGRLHLSVSVGPPHAIDELQSTDDLGLARASTVYVRIT